MNRESLPQDHNTTTISTRSSKFSKATFLILIFSQLNMHYIFMPATPLWMITEDLLKSLYRARLTRNGVHYTMKNPQYPYPPGFYAHERYSQIRQHNDEIRNVKVLPAPPERTEEAWPLRDESESEERPTLPEEIKQAAWEACGQILFSGIEARSRRNSKNRRSDNGEAAHGNFI